MAWETHTSTTVEADRATVWTVLTDFETYEEWNPTLPRARGSAEIGERLWLVVALPNRVTVPVRPRVTVVEAERELRWQVSLGDLVRTEHVVSIERRPSGVVRLEQSERVDGPLAIPFMEHLGGPIRDGIEAMSAALATRAQARERNA